MGILENISKWGGIAGIVVAVFAIIILYLTRSNIVDLLNKDAIMYDKVYEIKKKAIQSAFDILDYYEIYGLEVRSSKQFIQKAKVAFNDLMCVANTPKVYETFYLLTLEPSHSQITVQEIADFKNLCRVDLGLNVKKTKKSNINNSIVSQIGGTGSVSAPRPMPRPMRNDEE